MAFPQAPACTVARGQPAACGSDVQCRSRRGRRHGHRLSDGHPGSIRSRPARSTNVGASQLRYVKVAANDLAFVKHELPMILRSPHGCMSWSRKGGLRSSHSISRSPAS